MVALASAEPLIALKTTTMAGLWQVMHVLVVVLISLAALQLNLTLLHRVQSNVALCTSSSVQIKESVFLSPLAILLCTLASRLFSIPWGEIGSLFHTGIEICLAPPIDRAWYRGHFSELNPDSIQPCNRKYLSIRSSCNRRFFFKTGDENI